MHQNSSRVRFGGIDRTHRDPGLVRLVPPAKRSHPCGRPISGRRPSPPAGTRSPTPLRTRVDPGFVSKRTPWTVRRESTGRQHETHHRPAPRPHHSARRPDSTPPSARRTDPSTGTVSAPGTPPGNPEKQPWTPPATLMPRSRHSPTEGPDNTTRRHTPTSTNLAKPSPKVVRKTGRENQPGNPGTRTQIAEFDALGTVWDAYEQGRRDAHEYARLHGDPAAPVDAIIEGFPIGPQLQKWRQGNGRTATRHTRSNSPPSTPSGTPGTDRSTGSTTSTTSAAGNRPTTRPQPPRAATAQRRVGPGWVAWGSTAAAWWRWRWSFPGLGRYRGVEIGRWVERQVAGWVRLNAADVPPRSAPHG
jgi:hypothetical protein